MPKSAAEIGAILAAFQMEMRSEFMRLSILDRKIKGKLTRTWMPSNADLEYKDLFRKASSPWLEFTRDAIAQGIVCDGYTNDRLWKDAWMANGMSGRQNGIWRETVGFGKTFILVIPGGVVVDVLDDETNEVIGQRQVADTSTVVMRPLSALQTFAHFRDPWDETPEWVLTRVGKVTAAKFWESRWMFIDREAVYRFEGNAASPRPDTVRTFEHGMGSCPVAQVSNTLPMGTEPESSVERAIPIYERIVDATFTLEMVQRYGAFPQKYMSGGTIGTDAAGKSTVNASVDSMLTSTDPETRFGNFTQANLTDVASAKDSHIKDLAAVCQVPPHYLLGAVVNMSAEGIAAAESGYFRNVGERQLAGSEGLQLAMRLAGEILGEDVSADDDEMHFEDVSARSLAQIADAVGKLYALTGPLASLFALVPGFTKRDAEDAVQAAEKTRNALPPKADPLAIEAPVPPIPVETP